MLDFQDVRLFIFTGRSCFGLLLIQLNSPASKGEDAPPLSTWTSPSLTLPSEPPAQRYMYTDDSRTSLTSLWAPDFCTTKLHNLILSDNTLLSVRKWDRHWGQNLRNTSLLLSWPHTPHALYQILSACPLKYSRIELFIIASSAITPPKLESTLDPLCSIFYLATSVSF